MQAPRAATGRQLPRRAVTRTLGVALVVLAATACQDGTVTAPTPAPPIAATTAAAAASVPTDTVSVRDSVRLAVSSTLHPTNAPIAWTSSDSSVAVAMPNGYVRAVASGSAILRAAQAHTTIDSVHIVVRVPDAVPAPSPAAPKVATTPTTASPAAVLAFMGAAHVPTVAATQAMGGAYARYESDFAHFADYQWGVDSTSPQGANFYDRAMIYYVWWARTGNATYLDRANKLALVTRDYLAGKIGPDPANPTADILNPAYYPQSYRMMLDGVALHALVTGDTGSAKTVALVADNMANPHGYWNYTAGVAPTSGSEGDPRNSARVLNAIIDASVLGVQSPAGYDYRAIMQDLVGRITAGQAANGSYPWTHQCGFNKPYMVGMLNDALIRYYTQVQADPRVVTSVKNAVDYMWTSDWFSASSAFTYIEGTCASSSESGGAPGAADLNNLISSGYAFVAKQTGDASYYAKADAVFSGGVYGAWLYGPKQFNQEYTASYRYLSLRF